MSDHLTGDVAAHGALPSAKYLPDAYRRLQERVRMLEGALTYLKVKEEARAVVDGALRTKRDTAEGLEAYIRENLGLLGLTVEAVRFRSLFDCYPAAWVRATLDKNTVSARVDFVVVAVPEQGPTQEDSSL